MEEITDHYITVTGVGEGLYKEKGSKFISLAYHVESEDEVKEKLAEVKKQYYDARHHCYAFRLGLGEENSRSNDDGEPSGSAGKPILNQILSAEVYQTLVVVVRYFGGTKLGVSGLVTAYKTAAREALEMAPREERFLTTLVDVRCDYDMIDAVMRFARDHQLDISEQNFGLDCRVKFSIKNGALDPVLSKLEKWHQIDVKVL